MRIQILPLPPVVVGDLSKTPFAVVVDECDQDAVSDLASLGMAVQEIGAEGVLVFARSVQVV